MLGVGWHGESRKGFISAGCEGCELAISWPRSHGWAWHLLSGDRRCDNLHAVSTLLCCFEVAVWESWSSGLSVWNWNKGTLVRSRRREKDFLDEGPFTWTSRKKSIYILRTVFVFLPFHGISVNACIAVAMLVSLSAMNLACALIVPTSSPCLWTLLMSLLLDLNWSAFATNRMQPNDSNTCALRCIQEVPNLLVGKYNNSFSNSHGCKLMFENRFGVLLLLPFDAGETTITSPCCVDHLRHLSCVYLSASRIINPTCFWCWTLLQYLFWGRSWFHNLLYVHVRASPNHQKKECFRLTTLRSARRCAPWHTSAPNYFCIQNPNHAGVPCILSYLHQASREEYSTYICIETSVRDISEGAIVQAVSSSNTVDSSPTTPGMIQVLDPFLGAKACMLYFFQCNTWSMFSS